MVTVGKHWEEDLLTFPFMFCVWIEHVLCVCVCVLGGKCLRKCVCVCGLRGVCVKGGESVCGGLRGASGRINREKLIYSSTV